MSWWRRPRRARTLVPRKRLMLTMRQDVREDANALRSLAWLNARALPDGPWLVAEVDGSIQAAVQLRGVEALADPQSMGGELISLLRHRVMQLTDLQLELELATMADVEISDADWDLLLGGGAE
jgi:hypothetical protein